MEVQILPMKFLNNLSSLALISILFISPAYSQSELGVVNLVRIYQEYSLVQEANRLITEGEDGLKRVITTAEAEMKKLEGKSDEATDKKREEIQAAVDDKVEAIHDLKEGYNMRINRNIQNTINEIAMKKGYLAVLDKSFSLFSADDITTELLTELEKIK